MDDDFYFEEDADLLNDVTFGLCDIESNDDWETQHERVSKFLEIEYENVKKQLPLKLSTKEHLLKGDDYDDEEQNNEEDVIIGNSISQLGLDDDKEFTVKASHRSKSIEFAESQESWMSPPRLKNRNSLDELISPGEGIWASPSREVLEDNQNTPSNHPRPYNELPYNMSAMPSFGNLLNNMDYSGKIGYPYPYPIDQFQMSPLMMINKQFILGGFQSPVLLGAPPVFSPHIIAQNPFLHDPVAMHMNATPNQRNYNGREGSLYQNYYRNSQPWKRYNETDYDEDDFFVKMNASQMMSAKEKEWIFKISLMSILSGDCNISDFYFISYMEHKQLKKSQDKQTNKSSSDEEELCENLEKAKQLLSYKSMHSKESYKPVKFEGSLGKLSITSVHHPRQIMDLASSEQDSQILTKMPELSKKKFLMFGLVEKMYSIYLSLSDLTRSLLDLEPEEQELVLQKRSEKITQIFCMMKIGLHNTDKESDGEHFLNLMSISKARKLLPRIFLLFNQVQSESLTVALIHFLPPLLKKDTKEQAFLSLVEKIRITLAKSKETFKIKCIRLLRKVSLKIILSYQFSLQLLTIVLKSFTIRDPVVNLDWIYYETEVPKVLKELDEDLAIRNQSDILSLEILLGI
ncbi:protein PAT1 homolog 1 isoform X4 [Hydra vulgaris]|uniref:Protein PAT1 homolog 1 isoform X4 n=1 Tax=Hydra vulgaris TaxID=6087 RepID=A0ABM4D1D9_HYDVU